METQNTSNYSAADQKNNNQQDNSSKEPRGSFIISLMSHFVAIPLFLIVHKLVPEIDWPFHLDRILLFILTVGIIETIFKVFKPLVTLTFIVFVVWLSYGSIWGNYGFKNLYKDYKYMVYSMFNSPHPESIILSKLTSFPNKSEIMKAINCEDSIIRNFAVEAVKNNFNTRQKTHKERSFVQYFSVFKEVNSKWHYVNDPKNREYFASACESIKHLSGDCDDHSILMAASIRSIGGTVRLVHTTGHLYPELLIGDKDDLEMVNFLIKRKLFTSESSGKSLKYHIDEYGEIWLNLDYTAEYPGGEFMNEEILGVLRVD